MSHVSEQPLLAAPPSAQDVFLNQARRDRLTVSICLVDGRQFDARIKGFDRFSLVVEAGGADHLVFKHAVSTIASGRSLASYTPADRD